MDKESPDRTDLAQRRPDARLLVEHLRFVEGNVVVPALVDEGLSGVRGHRA